MERASALESTAVVLRTSYRKTCVVQLGGDPQRVDIEWFRCRIRGCKTKHCVKVCPQGLVGTSW